MKYMMCEYNEIHEINRVGWIRVTGYVIGMQRGIAKSMKIAIYSRKSKYTGKGESIENQVQMCKDYIRFKSFEFKDIGENDIAVYEDEGYSGKNLDRPQFQEMMKRARQKQLDCIVCYKLDRISRSVSDFSCLIEEFNNLGVSFICIKDDFDTKTSMGRAMMNMVSTFAQLERETIAERVKDNMMMLSRTGRWLGGTPPTGFVSEQVTEVIMDGKSKTSFKLKWNPNEMTVVKMIYTKFMELQSLSGVSKFLFYQNQKTRNGTYYTPLVIKDILTNPVYCIADNEARNYFIQKNSKVYFDEQDCSDRYGLLSYNKRNYTHKFSRRLDESEWIIAIGKHQGIIAGCDWVKIQQKVAENKAANIGHKKIKNDYALLSGLIICKKCNARMFAKQRSHHENLFDYICYTKLRGGKAMCNCENLNGQETDRLVCDFFLDHLAEGADAYRRFEKLKKDIQNADDCDPILTMKAEIGKRQQQINNYVDSLGNSNVSDALFETINAKVSELNQQIQKLEIEKEQLNSKLKALTNQQFEFDGMIRSLSGFQNNFKSLTVPERRELIRLLVDRIEWDGINLNIFIYGK